MGSLPLAGGAKQSQVGNIGKRRAGWRCPLSTSTSKRSRNIPQPWGLVLELSNTHYLKRESSPQNPIPDRLLQGDWAGRWGPVSRAGMQWVSLPTPQPQEAAVSICTAKCLCLSLLLSRSNIPKISSLLQQPCKVRTWGRTMQIQRGWVEKQQDPKSRAGGSIPFGALPERESRNTHIPPRAGRERAHPWFEAG